MKDTLQLATALAAVVLLIASVTFAQAGVGADGDGVSAANRKPAPTTELAPETCTQAGCHADVLDHQAVHGPLNVNACAACHELTDAEQHQYRLARERQDLCGFCHQVETEGAVTVHEPLKTGDCLGCHDPHGGFDQNLLRSRSMNELCSSCHQDVVGDARSVHGPVAAGACGACHPLHTSENEKLLVQTGRELCQSCHQEMQQQFAAMPFKHQPVSEGCMQCHDPHASDHPMMTRLAPGALCTASCHADVKQAVEQAKFGHSAVTQDAGCTNCHTAHGSELAALMQSRPVELCLNCHAEPVQTPDGRSVEAVTEITREDLVKHGPVRDGSCGGCHNVHGSDVSRLLVDPYPETFYESFDAAKYSLCFECHNRQMVLEPTTTQLTNFRDGQTNLHHLHVNKTKRGRTCRACHKTHASPNELHVRESVPYGNWALPINFTKTEQGGSCASGCHQELAYNRVDPANPQNVPGGEVAVPEPGQEADNPSNSNGTEP